jgi:hypothetical protein
MVDTYLTKVPDDAIACDVLVVGAGASGIPAAIAAARQGARVILLEEDLVPGGAPVDQYITFLCGGPRVGIFREMAERLNARHNLTGVPVAPFRDGGEDGREYWYLPTAYLQELSAMLAAEPTLTTVCGSPVSRVIVEDGPRRRVRGVVVDVPGLPSRAYTAPVTIDATGSGLIAALAGCEVQYGRNARTDFAEAYGPEQADDAVQPCTWMFISQRLRPDATLPDAVPGGGFVESNHHWVRMDDPAVRARNAGIYLHWGVTVPCADTRDPRALAMASGAALTAVEPALAVLRAHGYAVHLAPRIGVRESRRVMGEAVVTATDLLDSRFPDDTVAVCAFFLDAWGEHHQLPRTPVRAGIPYRALVPRGTEGLLIAGKSISGTHLAMSAYRVQPILASVGTAAGIAAAMSARLQTGVREIPLPELLRELQAMGTITG